MGWALAAPLIGAAISGLAGGASARAANKPTRTDTTRTPWAPTMPHLQHGIDATRTLFDQQLAGERYQLPPELNTSRLYDVLDRGSAGVTQTIQAGAPPPQGEPVTAPAAGAPEPPGLREEIRLRRQSRGLPPLSRIEMDKEIQREIARQARRGGGAPAPAPRPRPPDVIHHPRGGGGPVLSVGGGGGAAPGVVPPVARPSALSQADANAAATRERLLAESQQTSPGVQAGLDAAQRIVGFDLQPWIEQQLGAAPPGLGDDPLAGGMREMLERRYRRQLEESIAGVGDRFDATGMGGGSLDALQQSYEKSRTQEALADAMVQAELGLRQQNIEHRGQTLQLLGDAMSWQVDALGQIPALEEARQRPLETLSQFDLSVLAQQTQREIAKIDAQARRYAADRSAQAQQASARLSAAASRYASDSQRYVAELNARQRQREFDFGAELELAGLSHQDALRQWEYDQGLAGSYLDDYLRRMGGIGQLGGREQGTSQGPRQSVLGAGLLGTLAGASAGAGLYGQLKA